jgi:hypothetical protein
MMHINFGSPDRASPILIYIKEIVDPSLHTGAMRLRQPRGDHSTSQEYP